MRISLIDCFELTKVFLIKKTCLIQHGNQIQESAKQRAEEREQRVNNDLFSLKNEVHCPMRSGMLLQWLQTF